MSRSRISKTRSGGFFFTSDDHETLIHRIKAFRDDAIPAGNGIAAFVLSTHGISARRVTLSHRGGTHGARVVEDAGALSVRRYDDAERAGRTA